MVARVRGYYGTPFEGFQWVTQGGPLYQNLFKIMAEVLVMHWLGIIVKEAVGTNGSNPAVQRMDELFYAKNGKLALTQSELLQW